MRKLLIVTACAASMMSLAAFASCTTTGGFDIVSAFNISRATYCNLDPVTKDKVDKDLHGKIVITCDAPPPH